MHQRAGGPDARVRALLSLAVAALIVVVPATAAFADGGEEDFTARDYVEQAIGLLQGQPDMTDLIEDRIGDAIEDDEVEGVDLSLVEQAQQAFEAGRSGETLDLLARSIGEEVGPGLHKPEVGGGLQAPQGTSGAVLIALAAVLMASGGLIARRVR